MRKTTAFGLVLHVPEIRKIELFWEIRAEFPVSLGCHGINSPIRTLNLGVPESLHAEHDG